jgi:hypothetical protein
MMVKDRITDLRTASAKRSSHAGPDGGAETGAPPASLRSRRRVHLANPQRAIGWFLVSVGLRLAVSRTRTGPAR